MEAQRALSTRTTTVLALVLVAAISWLASRGSVLDQSLDHVGSIVRRVERSVELALAADRAKSTRWSWLAAFAESPEEARRQAIRLYRRAIDRAEGDGRLEDARTLRAHLAAELADDGKPTEADREVALLARSRRACGFCDAVRALASTPAPELGPASLEPLRAGSTATRLRIRLLEARGEAGEATRFRHALDDAARARLLRVGAFLLFAAMLLYAGILSLVFELRYPAWRMRASAPAPVAPWPSSEAIGVFVRSEFAGLALSLLASGVACAGAAKIVCVWDAFFWSLPVLWLVRRHLVGRSWRALAADFRLEACGLGAAEIARAALGLLAIVWLAGAVITPIFRALGWDAELGDLSFDPWIMDAPGWLALSGVNAVVWAPLAEEISFRGLLYMGLRKIARAEVAAAASAALFAAAHLYSFPAFAEVFLTGLVLAAGFERYRSLLPALFGHAALNLVFVGFNVVAYR